MTSQVLTPAAPGHPRAQWRIGALLQGAGKLTPDCAERAARLQQELGIRFGEAALRLNLVSEADIGQALALQFDYPYLQEGEGGYGRELAAAYDPFGPQAETLRGIRSQLMLHWFGRGQRALAVASLAADDGASVFAANLALVLAQLGEQTLLVDANLRQPRQHELFALGARPGLADVLAGRAEPDVAARIGPFANLSVLAAGTVPPNPQELLSREAFRVLNAQLESRYDVVLYDVAPFALGADALALAGRAGGALLVARKDHTRLAGLARMAAQLKAAGAELVGSVVVDF